MYDFYYFALSTESEKQKQLEFTVTLVDDDPLFREALQDYLVSMNIRQIEIFSSGEEFLSKTKATDQRFVVSDFDFGTAGKLNGGQLLEEIRKRSPQMPVVILSAQDNLAVALETLRKGAIDYFIKGNQSTFTTVMTSILKTNEIFRLKKDKRDYLIVGVIGAALFAATLFLAFLKK